MGVTVNEVSLKRIQGYDDFTLGSMKVNGVLQAWTLEDEKRAVKVKGETRIPAGRYQIKLRKAGRIHENYASRFPWHQGVLWLQNVPNFQYIYIHIGNTDDHTEGCILVGNTANIAMNKITSSGIAYERVYKMIVQMLNRGEEVWITVEDE